MFVHRLSLALARFCSAAWVGAAVLFVIAGISEVRSPQLDSSAKDLLVLLRFPCYYAIGFSLVIAAFIGASVSQLVGPRSITVKIASGLLLLALLGMVVDHTWIYTPLENHIKKQGPRDATFETLHEASKWINLATVSITMIASGMLSLERRELA
ncbi:MAG: hypothetical protein O2955_10345 [Planctomycetota bacterium]|nr:hypothetical protein [Planctomycetota bacterium]MDA1212910.1 hypothetical protein [Planctomycetota bacterium]